jgi:alpha-glucosidase
MEKQLWWQDGVVYQIYPRSFMDSNEDGFGDLPGILSRLDYLSELGIGAIWLSPIYPSPDVDFGYDVAEHKAVDPRYGSLADFDQLIAQAHQRGIRIILDMVMNHTSDQHAWFSHSRSSRADPKRDWYLWRDRPNNWQASFGGRAWEYDRTTHQYYYHMFAKEQPDLNWRNPEVRKAQLDVFRFWLERGVDGFRLDVFNMYFKDAEFRDNPGRFGLRGFDQQRHLYDCDQPEMFPLLGELRALLDSYPERYAVGETFLSSPERAAAYVSDEKLHAAFSFDFTTSELSFPWNAVWARKQIEHREAVFVVDRWPTTVLGNHDLPRTASRYCRGEDDAQAKLAMGLLLTLRGTPFLYYGDEIGMRNLPLRREEILDPPGKYYWPFYKGRDVCRAPMQWDGSRYAGFSNSKPWLKVHPDSAQRNVAAQRSNPDSLFTFTRKLIALRKEFPALRQGDLVSRPAPHGSLIYQRRSEGQTIQVMLNFTRKTIPLPREEAEEYKRWELLLSTSQEGTFHWQLKPNEGVLLLTTHIDSNRQKRKP